MRVGQCTYSRDSTPFLSKPGIRFSTQKMTPPGHLPTDSHSRVAAHRTITLIMHEDNPNVAPGKVRGHQQDAMHVEMAARFPHDQFPVVICVSANPRAFFQKRFALRCGEARLHDAHGLSPSVHQGREDAKVACKLRRPVFVDLRIVDWFTQTYK